MTATVDTSLRLGYGFQADERDHVVETLSRLEEPLQSFGDGRVELDLSVKERDQPGQRMTLEAKLGSLPRMVATSEVEQFDGALHEVRDDLLRQLSDAKQQVRPPRARRD